MTRRNRPWFAITLLAFIFASAASARVLSYAPYTDRSAFPAVQHRLNRHFVLVEGTGGVVQGPVLLLPPIYAPGVFGQLVLYDFRGLEEPRVIFPQDGSQAWFTVAAVREGANEVPTILIQTNAKLGNQNPQGKHIFLLSTDGGRSWKHVLLPDGTVEQLPGTIDVGGPLAKNRYSPVRIGTAEFPFVVQINGAGIYAVGVDAVGKALYPRKATEGDPVLMGSDRTGQTFLIRTPNQIYTIGVDGTLRSINAIDPATTAEGWITPSGEIYLDTRNGNTVSIWVVRTLPEKFLTATVTSPFPPLFAIPTADYSGAWIIQREAGKPTILYRHSASEGLKVQWEDITSPEVEALHAGLSGNTLLIQVHRPRPQADQRIFLDPALAVWRVGEPAPKAYDELFMNEQYLKGFVHIDVDAVEQGEPFVFDSGPTFSSTPGVITSPAVPVAGGSDVIQEYGVVRASFKQQLILPGVARVPGAYNSFWLTDLILYNPLEEAQDVAIRFTATGQGVSSSVIPIGPNDPRLGLFASVTLGPREIRAIPDALKALFNIDAGGGVLTFMPEAGINVTSRTYTQSAKGTFGFGLNAIDMYNSIGPRFPVTFAGAFPGTNFRTNLLLTDVSGRGGEAQLRAAGTSGAMGSANVLVDAPANGVLQFNDIRSTLGLASSDTGALLLRPSRGQVIPTLVTIDNLTNDPTYFSPDLPAPFVRTIPVVGHVDGANNSKFRTDLYLYNPTAKPAVVRLQIKLWDSPENIQPLALTLLANEARVIRDVLLAAFGKTGIARLRYDSVDGVRVTARTYNINEDGGTYGFLSPPLNNFQIAGPGDTLEILGAVNDARFRTNVGFVELTAFANGLAVNVEIEIVNEVGVMIDRFTTNVAVAGGRQIDDIFKVRGLTNVKAALIRITPVTGMIGGYAAIVDNGTNDPTYLGANLAARQ